jgi:predicted DNA-binding WGR domain protein
VFDAEMIRLECRDAKHDKFWEGAVAGSTLTVHFGRIGTDGQTKTKKLASPEAAKHELEKLIREKLGKGYAQGKAKPKGVAAKPAKAATTPRVAARSSRKSARPPTNARALLRLAALLAPKRTAIAKRLALAIDDPATYAKKYADDLEDRFAEDEPVDPWLQLVIGLADDDAPLACSLDWKSPAESIAGNLDRAIAAQAKLRKNPKLFDAKKLLAFYDEDQHLKTKTIDFIELCGRAFSAHGLALIELDISSDSYELTVIPWKDLPLAQKLAKEAGGAILHHGPKKPLASPLGAPAPKPKSSVKLEKRRIAGLLPNRNFVQVPGLLHRTHGKPSVTSLFDCRTWPPTKAIVKGTGKLEVIIHETDGSLILHNVYYELLDDEEFEPRPKGTLRIERPKKPAVDLLDRLPDSFDIEAAAWIGDLAVLLPAETTVRGKTARRPLVWNGKTLAPAKGLPDATAKRGTRSDPWPSFLRMGHARTGTGTDVLIWEGAGWVAKGETFVKKWKLHPDLDPDEQVIGAPAPGDGFFYTYRVAGKTTIRHAANGKSTEFARVPHGIDLPLRTVSDGRVLFGLNRYANPKEPVLGVLHPETREVTLVPPEVLGFRKDDTVDAYGMTVPKNGAAYLWVVDAEELRRISWDAILALPRVPAAPSPRG